VAESTTEIANLALSYLGSGKLIADLDTERSEEARTIRRFYAMARDATLRDFAWPFANKLADLDLVEEDPTDEWAYSYRYPADCVKALRVPSGIRNDTRQSRIPFKVSQDDSGQIIYCDLETATLEYTKRIEDPTRYPADFVLAFAQRLAACIAPCLAGGDPYKLGERSESKYDRQVSRAKISASDEGQVEEEVESEFIRSRE
jgi:hypothetical protein